MKCFTCCVITTCEVHRIDAPALPPKPVRAVDDAAPLREVNAAEATKASDELCSICNLPARPGQMVKCTWDELVRRLNLDQAPDSSCQNMLHEDCAISCRFDDDETLKFCRIHHPILRVLSARHCFGEFRFRHELNSYRHTQATPSLNILPQRSDFPKRY